MTMEGTAPSVPSVEVADARIAAALADPSVRDWVKDALRSANGKDPVDAAQDADLVTRLLGERLDAILGQMTRV